MHVYVQYATLTPQDWVRIEPVTTPNAWRSLPKKSDPLGTVPSLNDQPGWVFALNTQGIIWNWCEKVAVEVVSNALVISNDYRNPAYYPPGWRYRLVWQINNLRQDLRYGGRYNTAQYVSYYCEPTMLAFMQSLPPTPNITLYPYADYKAPNETNTRYGPDMTETQANALLAAESFHNWSEWDHTAGTMLAAAAVLEEYDPLVYVPHDMDAVADFVEQFSQL